MTDALPLYSRLPLTFPTAPLQAELARLPETAWQPHFNSGYFSGDWSGIALLAAPSAGTRLHVDRQAGRAEPTALLRDYPSWWQWLEQLPCSLTSARLLRLGPGAQIREHCDPDLGGPDGDLRLHLPILSHPEVEFILDGHSIPMQPGELWFLDLSRPHRVENRSDQTRVHLVLDCQRNPWLLQQIEQGLGNTPAAVPPRGALDFARFRALAHQDRNLLEQLLAVDDPRAFAELARTLAASKGLHFSEGEVQTALRQGRRAWFDQWTV
ncbi:MAG: aspartyl/asparaginyl beta-hydroxylase domain-containing protein [Pseudomonas sp.]|uniref:aspartyl/asparaginyl beta-hydroxylase domain-containing protein n=1 Tax=Pseudomonas sp. TaxID=306 RepID=UPI0033920BAC